MSFNVSNSFKMDETIDRSLLSQLFQFPRNKNVKQPQNRPPIPPCFKLSVVSIYIHIKIESLFEKVLGAAKRERAFLSIGRQDYTGQPAASSLQKVHHA
tara:strand:- start:2286 stop:2582 length:297 start_codon:yes stop_codon:yes gene_type:complete